MLDELEACGIEMRLVLSASHIMNGHCPRIGGSSIRFWLAHNRWRRLAAVFGVKVIVELGNYIVCGRGGLVRRLRGGVQLIRSIGGKMRGKRGKLDVCRCHDARYNTSMRQKSVKMEMLKEVDGSQMAEAR
jgi:hypothetical protein